LLSGLLLFAAGALLSWYRGSDVARGWLSPTPDLPRPPPAWPDPGARLQPPPLPDWRNCKTRRVYIDAGHGAPGNAGAIGAYCEDEQVHTLRVSEHLAAMLRETGCFEVKVSRSGDQIIPYQPRVAEAEAWPADVFLSIHGDARDGEEWWTPGIEGKLCPFRDAGPGFSVLWSDRGTKPQNQRRLTLARDIARQMERLGLPAYSGEDYAGYYEQDDAQYGVWVDRHRPGRRIYVLFVPSMPSVIIETHHTRHREEALRWLEPATVEAFGVAVMGALHDYFAKGDVGSPRRRHREAAIPAKRR